MEAVDAAATSGEVQDLSKVAADEAEKEKRKLKKKLRQIEDLVKALSLGDRAATPEEQVKIGQREALLAQIEALEPQA